MKIFTPSRRRRAGARPLAGDFSEAAEHAAASAHDHVHARALEDVSSEECRAQGSHRNTALGRDASELMSESLSPYFRDRDGRIHMLV